MSSNLEHTSIGSNPRTMMTEEEEDKTFHTENLESILKSETAKEMKKRKYSYISLASRKELIKLVYKEGKQIKEAAADIGVNYSTAKHIIKVFKNTGNIETQPMLKNRISPIDIHILEQKINEYSRTDSHSQYSH